MFKNVQATTSAMTPTDWTLASRRLFVALFALFILGFSPILCAASIASLSSNITRMERSVNSDRDDIKQLEQKIWALDQRLLETRQALRHDRDDRNAKLNQARRDQKMQSYEIGRLESSIEIIEGDLENARRDNQRSQELYESLNAMRRQLESESHRRRMESNQHRISQLQREKKLLGEKLILETEKMRVLTAQLVELQEERPTTLDDNPRLVRMMEEREQYASRINQLRREVRQELASLDKLRSERTRLRRQVAQQQSNTSNNQTAQAETAQNTNEEQASTQEGHPSYVFVISGDHITDIEEHLKLKDWVESYGAQYIKASWRGLPGGDADHLSGASRFKFQFANKLREIPQQAKIILVGHGRGGGAAIEAATQVAFDMDRIIDFLAVLDPIGTDNLRANIVFDTASGCTPPVADDPVANAAYLACIRDARPRMITTNIKHFYNRWQKEGQGPKDYQRLIEAIDDRGKGIQTPTATGRFHTADGTQADQKRAFFQNSKNAHELLLTEEAKNLPRLLVRHLR